MRTLLLCSFSAFLITLAASFSASAASFTSLGDLAGGIFQSFAFGTSADGSTVV